MLEKIKKHTPKTYDSLSKIIKTKTNATQKILDYEQKIKEFDTELVNLEAESCKNPSNKLNEKIEDLSAKRYGLMFRYEALKNGTSNLFTKEDIDKIVDIYKKEYTENLIGRINAIALQYQTNRSICDEKIKKIENEWEHEYEQLRLEEVELRNIVDSLAQTIAKYYRQTNLSDEEILRIMNTTGLPFSRNTDKAI